MHLIHTHTETNRIRMASP